MMKRLSILGSTGSIGRNTLEIVKRFPEHYSVTALAAGRNVDLLAEQVRRYTPEVVAVLDETLADRLQRQLPRGTKTDIHWGRAGYLAAATSVSADMVVSAMVGAAGLLPTLAAIEAGKQVALANKETLVMAGELVVALAKEKQVDILPVDSEHSAIFQCLAGNRASDLQRILLTASGGPFLNLPVEQFNSITPEAALNHPNWRMGPKISIDSATLMNKGLEVIEAMYLFDVSISRIQVIIHPQSIIHSMVAYRDGSVIAQLGVPDMKGAIAYALSYPDRLPLGQPLPDFDAELALTFQRPDLKRFTCLELAFAAGNIGGTMPAVLNAANEIAVNAFLNHSIPFSAIPAIVRDSLERHSPEPSPALEEILAADRWARETAEAAIRKYS